MHIWNAEKWRVRPRLYDSCVQLGRWGLQLPVKNKKSLCYAILDHARSCTLVFSLRAHDAVLIILVGSSTRDHMLLSHAAACCIRTWLWSHIVVVGRMIGTAFLVSANHGLSVIEQVPPLYSDVSSCWLWIIVLLDLYLHLYIYSDLYLHLH